MRPPRSRPLSERMTLDASQLHVVRNLDGMALRFGPGPLVVTFECDDDQADKLGGWALDALFLLNKTLAGKDA